MYKPTFQLRRFVTDRLLVKSILTFCGDVGFSFKWVILSSLVLVLAVLAAFFVTLTFNLIWCEFGWESRCNELYSIRENFSLIRNMVLGIFATVGLMFAHQRIRLAENAQEHELYRLGASLMGDESLATRVAGISTLRQLKVRNSTEFVVPIMDSLAVHIASSESRVQASKLSSYFTIPKSRYLSATKMKALLLVRLDITEAVIVISERSSDDRKLYSLRRNSRRIDLSRASLNGLSLRGVNLFDVNFYQAKLVCASLVDSDLRNCIFVDSYLVGANLEKSNCSKTIFLRAIMCKASLKGTILKETNLMSVNLEGANLSDAKFGGANLDATKLSGANLSGANLKGAKNLKPDQLKYICHSSDAAPKVDKGIVWDKQAAVKRWENRWKPE